MKVLVVISLLCMVNVAPSVCSVIEKFKEFEVVPDILTVAPSKLLEVGIRDNNRSQEMHKSVLH